MSFRRLHLRLGARVSLPRPGKNPLWRRVLIGLGDVAEAAEVRVRWLDGSVERWSGAEIDRDTTPRQGTGANVR